MTDAQIHEVGFLISTAPFAQALCDSPKDWAAALAVAAYIAADSAEHGPKILGVPEAVARAIEYAKRNRAENMAAHGN